MSYTERIYIQNENSCVRNKILFNVRTSGSWCNFTPPDYTISGATKIQGLSIGDEGLYLLGDFTEIPIIFNFSGSPFLYSASTTTTTFEIFKFDENLSAFTENVVYSNEFALSGLSNTNTYTENLPVMIISPDNEYLIKSYFEFNVCDDNFLGMLGVRHDNRVIISGPYGFYDDNTDYYLSISYSAEAPNLTESLMESNVEFGRLVVYTKTPTIEGQVEFLIDAYSGEPIINLNGVTLAPHIDYSLIDTILTFSAATELTDIITIAHTFSSDANGFSHHNILVNSITSGTTNNQANNDIYFNTTTGMYEIYTPSNMEDYSDVIVTINGVLLANGLDYYRSVSNNRRIILVGEIYHNDIINIYYYSTVTYIGDIYSNSPIITWYINRPPTRINGFFTLELSTTPTFTTLISSTIVNYVVGVSYYADTLSISGNVGTTYYYRVKNEKNYQPITGPTIDTIAYSDAIPIMVQTNEINSY